MDTENKQRKPRRPRRNFSDELKDGAVSLAPEKGKADWALLLRRTFDRDLRVCARCAGRLSVRAVVADPTAVEKILRALDRSRDPPAAAYAAPSEPRDPPAAA